MPRKVDVDERRAELAAAAARVIASVGLEGTTLRDVAAEAGWTTGALTHYFTDKRELLLLALRSSNEQLLGKQTAALEAGADELGVLLAQALPLDGDRTRHWRVSLTFTVQSWADPELSAEQRRAYRGWRRRIVTLLADGAAAGRFRPGLDAEREADELIALVDGVALQALYDPDRWPASKQRLFLTRALERLSS